MPRYWCVNFEGKESDAGLRYGISRNLWLMQYQYGIEKPAAVTQNWRRVSRISTDDWFVAYLSPKRFYAIGKVIRPRREPSPTDKNDSIEEFIQRRGSLENEGAAIYYTSVFYEDFSDDWRHPQFKTPYAQRIDVENWLYYVPDGIEIPWSQKFPVSEQTKAFFEINESFFSEIKTALMITDGESSTQSGAILPSGGLDANGYHGVVHSGQVLEASEELEQGVIDSNDELWAARLELESEGYFDPGNDKDERERTLREIAQRLGQKNFRDALLKAYGGCCAVTACDAPQALEAAHIVRYRGTKSNHVSNGFLLRSDIHTLFDLDLIRIEPHSLRIVVSNQLSGTCYGCLDGKILKLPKDNTLAPSNDALEARWNG